MFIRVFVCLQERLPILTISFRFYAFLHQPFSTLEFYMVFISKISNTLYYYRIYRIKICQKLLIILYLVLYTPFQQYHNKFALLFSVVYKSLRLHYTSKNKTKIALYSSFFAVRCIDPKTKIAHEKTLLFFLTIKRPFKQKENSRNDPIKSMCVQNVVTHFYIGAFQKEFSNFTFHLRKYCIGFQKFYYNNKNVLSLNLLCSTIWVFMVCRFLDGLTFYIVNNVIIKLKNT